MARTSSSESRLIVPMMNCVSFSFFLTEVSDEKKMRLHDVVCLATCRDW